MRENRGSWTSSLSFSRLFLFFPPVFFFPWKNGKSEESCWSFERKKEERKKLVLCCTFGTTLMEMRWKGNPWKRRERERLTFWRAIECERERFLSGVKKKGERIMRRNGSRLNQKFESFSWYLKLSHFFSHSLSSPSHFFLSFSLPQDLSLITCDSFIVTLFLWIKKDLFLLLSFSLKPFLTLKVQVFFLLDFYCFQEKVLLFFLLVFKTIILSFSLIVILRRESKREKDCFLSLSLSLLLCFQRERENHSWTISHPRRVIEKEKKEGKTIIVKGWEKNDCP